MINGCLDWQMNGFVRPKVVLDATNEYLSEQDLVQQWIDDCCETGDRNVCDTAANLYKSWCDHALANGEKPGTQRRISRLRSR